MDHKTIEKERLLKESLEETNRDHSLTHCPICSRVVEPLHCIRDAWKYRTKSYSLCSNCQIVWKLEIFNYTHERNDGMITGEGHLLYLQGYVNCYCRSEVFYTSMGHPISITIHKSDSGHATLHSKCSDFKKQTASPKKQAR